VAGGTILRSGLVEQHGFAFDLPHELVAIDAFHIRVYALKRKSSVSIVIEQRRLPLGAVVAFGTGRHVSFCELLAVRIFVALLAVFRRGLKVDVHHRSFKIWRLVAIDAGGGTMCTQQRESRLRVIELGQLLPRFCGMACLASAWTACSLCLLHALIELPIVRISMATGATQIRPVIDRGGGPEIGRLFVAIGTGNRNVLAGQKEVRLFMARQRERGRPIGLNRVATFAGIEIGCRSELAGMVVFVAVGAVLEFHFEHSIDASRDVAFLAAHLGVCALQRIRRSRVIGDGKC